VKSSKDISAEPVRGQKIDEPVVADLYVRNNENRPKHTKNTIDELAGAITGGKDAAGD